MVKKTEFKYPQYVFVYGTLKKGHSNYHSLLEGKAAYVGSATTKNSSYLMLQQGVPYAYTTEGTGHKIKGDLFLVKPEDMVHLDRLEGHPEWYRRRYVTLEDGTHAWMYLMQRDEFSVIEPENSSTRISPVNGVLEWHPPKYSGRIHKLY